MKNAEVLGTEISEKDEECLKYLNSLTFSTTFDEEKSHEIITFVFTFLENEWFTNKELVKKVLGKYVTKNKTKFDKMIKEQLVLYNKLIKN